MTSLLTLLLALGVLVQAPGGDTIRCENVLTPDEAVAAAGAGYTGPAVSEPRPGFTGCDWQGEDSNFGFTFANTLALRNDERKADDEFEFDVAAVEGDGKKREPLPGIGIKAALVDLGEDAFMIAVQRPDGVARMITYKVDRAKAIALARAIAAP